MKLQCLGAAAIAYAMLMPSVGVASNLTNAQQTAVLAEGHEAYARGLAERTNEPTQAKIAFERAVNRYGVLVDDGYITGPLLYNLGNAQVQAGLIGPAIATYLRAQTRMPADAKLAENLTYARSLVRTRVDADAGTALVERLLFWHYTWSPTLRLTFFALAWIVLWGLLITRCWKRVPGLRTTTALAGVASVAFGMSFLWPMIAGHAPIGVLIQDDVIVRKGDNTAFEPRFAEPIHQGVEFRVLESRPQWLHIELPDGQNGWVPSDAAELVGHSAMTPDGALASGRQFTTPQP
jgi:hypothetical protein